MTDLITVREAAQRLSCTGKHVITLCRAGKLSYNQEGRWFRVSSDSVKLYLHNTHFARKNLEPKTPPQPAPPIRK